MQAAGFTRRSVTIAATPRMALRRRPIGDRAEDAQHLIRRLRTVGGILLEQAHHQLGDMGRRRRPAPGQRLRRLRRVRREQLLCGPAL